MNRTTRYKTLYLMAVLVLAAGVVAIMSTTGAYALTLVFASVVLLVPGRIQGYFWRDFFRGRRLLGRGNAQDAIPYFMGFLDQLVARPWLKRLIWLSWGMHTRDIEVMTRINLGAALLLLGELEAAEDHLRTAMQLDPESPLPWHNLGLIQTVRGDEVAAVESFQRARALGYVGSVSDQLVKTAGEALARLEGRGTRG